MADEDRRELLYRLLGDLPERDRAVSAETISVETCEGYVVETLLLDLNGTEAVPAVLARPSGVRDPAPVILYSHAHGNDYELGKRELVDGRDVLQVIVEEGLPRLGGPRLPARHVPRDRRLGDFDAELQ